MWEDEMNMTERFEEIFEAVCLEHDCASYDSELMDEVEDHIADEFGVSIIESEEYRTWYNAMAEDL